MKNIKYLIVLLMVVPLSQTFSQVRPSVPFRKSGLSLLSYDQNFITTIKGPIDTVWQKVYPNPGFQDANSNTLFQASDGSFYLASERSGGFITKFSNDGKIDWQIDRDYSRDTSIKTVSLFNKFVERPNNEIVVFGLEGIRTLPVIVGNKVPMRTVITTKGVVKEEKSTRGTIDLFYSNPPILPFSDEVFFVSNAIDKFDTWNLLSVDTQLSQKIREIDIVNDIAVEDSWSEFGGIIPIQDNSFISWYQVRENLKNRDAKIVIERYSRDFKLLQKNIIPVSRRSAVSADENGEVIIGTPNDKFGITLKKFDINGNLLWERSPELLNTIPFTILTMQKSPKGGFVLMGELYIQKDDGSIDYKSAAYQAFIGKVTNSGEVKWYYSTGRKNFWNVIRNVAETPEGDIVFVCNSLNQEATSDPETPMQITRLRSTTSSVKDEPVVTDDGITLSPNPSSESFTISGIDNISSIKITNSLGMEVSHKTEVVGSKQEIDVSDLASGVYFVQMRTATGMITKPIVVRR